MTTAVSQVTDVAAFHGEGPVWVPGWGGLHLVDMLVGDVLAVDVASGAVARYHVGTVAAVVRPRTNGGAVLALERGFALLDPPDAATSPGAATSPDGGAEAGGPLVSPFGPPSELATRLRPLPELWDEASRIRMNEGGCDPDGGFYCGSMAYAKTPGDGALYRLGPDGAASMILPSVTISNGLAFSPDGTRAYYVDTPTRRVDAFDYSPADGLTDRRPWATVPAGPGFPDGLTVDAEGGVWVALWAGGAVCRFDEDGGLDAVVKIPVPQVTACAFGGPDLATLYVTTSQDETDTTAHPRSGAVFAVDPGVRGLPVLPFAG
ncbi:SMP-30/gluconolactonase/LRE family protein [Frankia sp. CNm7]|uniref:SMP-30/gluconolactonase/LRE family protein n=1 Tax=Frankia nepalensis TaxID=1836974 RepID=A0A937UJF3_9ACTN|nr:SMP-30/gluconolactonase/LRE family protein [Frankia nepalensis]MBL7502116.1 SMP-30/gluconolactonase/LRE family protein [Frankia nepalensis]MBL7512897.1 SMP-30/gluconolactonase/LRE family protein [Frankia nepalensis]MBL7518165.1 SMP-30/gluconolactonase/LRE family protein [Frankia nepalensis]MBL7625739.1 SMP-30/gluconolactonase/LRE family protein [Frankia nepalensis]